MKTKYDATLFFSYFTEINHGISDTPPRTYSTESSQCYGLGSRTPKPRKEPADRPRASPPGRPRCTTGEGFTQPQSKPIIVIYYISQQMFLQQTPNTNYEYTERYSGRQLHPLPCCQKWQRGFGEGPPGGPPGGPWGK